MAKQQSLTSMSVDALLKLQEEIGAALSRKADDLKNELKPLAQTMPTSGGLLSMAKSHWRVGRSQSNTEAQTVRNGQAAEHSRDG
jgi:hypothetical protein